MTAATVYDLRRGRPCGWCEASWAGWEEAHVIVTRSGQVFCSRTCLEGFESSQRHAESIEAEAGRVVA